MEPSTSLPLLVVRLSRQALCLALASLSIAALRATTVSDQSPFLPAAMSGQTPVDSFSYVLTGITKINSTGYCCIVDPQKKRARWIAVGSEVDGIEVVNCDYENTRALVKVGGESRILVLRKSATQKASFSPTPASRTVASTPPMGMGPPPPGGGPEHGDDPAQSKANASREEKEREARMLVSDMLEISMRQRKAYEEAKKKAEVEQLKKKQ
jgi:hypothetical protein